MCVSSLFYHRVLRQRDSAPWRIHPSPLSQGHLAPTPALINFTFLVGFASQEHLEASGHLRGLPDRIRCGNGTLMGRSVRAPIPSALIASPGETPPLSFLAPQPSQTFPCSSSRFDSLGKGRKTDQVPAAEPLLPVLSPQALLSLHPTPSLDFPPMPSAPSPISHHPLAHPHTQQLLHILKIIRVTPKAHVPLQQFPFTFLDCTQLPYRQHRPLPCLPLPSCSR